MIITLDGQRLDNIPAPGLRLDQVIEQVASGLRDRLIAAVRVNGEPLVDQSLEEALRRPLRPEDQLDLESAAPGPLAQSAMREMADRLGESAHANRELADLLRQGTMTGVGDGLTACTRVWVDCHRVIVEASRLLGRDLGEASAGGRPVCDALGEVAQQVRTVRDVLDARDWVSLADVLEYEMPALCERWQEMLGELADGLVAPPQPAV